MLELNRTLSFFQRKFVNKDKFSNSDDDTSASTTPPRLSSPPCLSSPLPNNHDVEGNDVDNAAAGGDDDDVDIGGKNFDNDKFGGYESYNSEDERAVNSLVANYKLVRKQQ